MKTILILGDLEGISGVSSMEQMNDRENGGYRYACERLAVDLNAAVRAAFDCGAERVLVEDGHGGGNNLLPGTLDPRAELVNTCAPDFTLDGVVAAMQVGAHAMSGTQCAFLDHTQSSVSWHDYFINGRRCGEMAQAGAYLGAFGIPCVMVSGDAACCQEARQFFGDIALAEVKTAVCRNFADCIPEDEAEQRIYDAAVRSMSLIGKVKPFRVILPAEIKLEFNRADYCDNLLKWRPDAERLDARTVRVTVREIKTFMDVLL